jgi:hypothetical protein
MQIGSPGLGEEKGQRCALADARGPALERIRRLILRPDAGRIRVLTARRSRALGCDGDPGRLLDLVAGEVARFHALVGAASDWAQARVESCVDGGPGASLYLTLGYRGGPIAQLEVAEDSTRPSELRVETDRYRIVLREAGPRGPELCVTRLGLRC